MRGRKIQNAADGFLLNLSSNQSMSDGAMEKVLSLIFLGPVSTRKEIVKKIPENTCFLLEIHILLSITAIQTRDIMKTLQMRKSISIFERVIHL